MSENLADETFAVEEYENNESAEFIFQNLCFDFA